MASSYSLDDAERLHRDAPRTFSIPRSEVRKSLRRGDFAKLVFLFKKPASDGCNAERMWCLVKRRDKQGYVGALSNHPRYLEEISHGDPIRFKARHIAAIERPEDDDAEELA